MERKALIQAQPHQFGFTLGKPTGQCLNPAEQRADASGRNLGGNGQSVGKERVRAQFFIVEETLQPFRFAMNA